jgi:hypothetical protein
MLPWLTMAHTRGKRHNRHLVWCQPGTSENSKPASGNTRWIFLYFGLFKKQFRDMNPPKTYLQDMTLLSRASEVGMTHEGVMTCALAWQMGQTHAPLSMWPPRGLSRAKVSDVTAVASTAVAWQTTLVHRTSIESRHVRRHDCADHHDVTPQQNIAPLPFSFFLPPFSSTHLAVAPLAILSSLPKSEPLVREIDSMSWYPNRVGYVCRLYRLILLYFDIFIWMNSCGRD